MKNWALLFITLLASTIAYSQNTLTVSDPRNWGGQQQGTIEQAVLEIRPAGAYLEFSMEFSLSSAGTYYNSVTDTVEAVLDFELPVGAIIHDSWLWVGQDIVQGLLIERNLATNTYEGIVNRRRDPSILFKNSDTQYQLRVFPMAGNESRRVKIKYLMPAKFSLAEMTAKLPIGMLKASKTVPSLLVMVHANATFKNPRMHGFNTVPQLQGPDSLNRYATSLTPNNISTSAELLFSFESPLQNGIFTAYYPQTQQSGYYQVVVDPTTISNSTRAPRKLVYIIHHEVNNSNISYAELLFWTKSFLKQQLTPDDYFNIVFTSNNNTLYHNTWVQATPASIDVAINYISNNTITNTTATIKQKMIIANNFVQYNGGTGEMLLASNHNKSYSNSQASSYIQDMDATFTFKAPMDIINYFDARGGRPANAEPLLRQLSGLFGGTYTGMDIQLVQTNSWSYTYQCYETLTDLFGRYVSNLNGNQLHSYDIYPTVSNGLTYSRYSLDNYNVSGSAKVQVGKYYGNGPIDFTLNALTDTGFVTHTWPAVTMYDTDTFSRKIWGGVYLESFGNNYNSQSNYQTIVDTSMAYRVLSYNTAFLCLEPGDTVSICEGCSSFEEENDWPFVGIDETTPNHNDHLGIVASPNPFTNNITITFEVPEALQGNPIQIAIVDMLGRKVAQVTISTMPGETTFAYNWNGNDTDGKNLPLGIYIVNASINGTSQTLKLVKTN